MKGLYFVTDRGLCGEKPLAEVVLQAVRGGASCVQLREKNVSTRFFVEEARRIYLDGEFRQMFRNLMFMRVMPNLRRIGLLSDSVRPLFEQLGMLQYENLKDDGDIDWAELSRPLFNA